MNITHPSTDTITGSQHYSYPPETQGTLHSLQDSIDSELCYDGFENVDISEMIDLFWDLKHLLSTLTGITLSKGLVQNLNVFEKFLLSFKKIGHMEGFIERIGKACI